MEKKYVCNHKTGNVKSYFVIYDTKHHRIDSAEEDFLPFFNLWGRKQHYCLEFKVGF